MKNELKIGSRVAITDKYFKWLMNNAVRIGMQEEELVIMLYQVYKNVLCDGRITGYGHDCYRVTIKNKMGTCYAYYDRHHLKVLK